ncbi:hypothetical protein D3C87_2211660 [compost metagenome]
MNLLVSRQRIPHHNVVAHGAKEQARLLAEELHIAAQIGRVEVIQRHIIEQNGALLRFLHPRQKL